MIRVVVADDQALVRGGMRMILDSQPDIEVVGEAADGRAALSITRECEPDVVLMDVRMPNLDGIDATRRLLAATDTPPKVLILTTFDLDGYVYVYEAIPRSPDGVVFVRQPQAKAEARALAQAVGGRGPTTVTSRAAELLCHQPVGVILRCRGSGCASYAVRHTASMLFPSGSWT